MWVVVLHRKTIQPERCDMRVTCVSDTHLTVYGMESESLFPKALAKMAKTDASELYERMRNSLYFAWESVRTEVHESSPDVIVHVGDVTGGWRESGMITSDVRHLAHQVVVGMSRITPRAFVCIGNHDIGYSHPGSLGGGMTEDSIFFAEQIFRDLWWKFERDGVLHLGVASPIAEYVGKEESIARRVRTQRQFVGDALSAHDGPWVLYTHSPWAVGHLSREIEVQVDNLQQVVAGDLHNPSRGTMLRALAKGYVPMAKHTRRHAVVQALSKTVVCPSTAPLWWPGHGFMNLDIVGDSVRVAVRTAPRAYSGRLPTESAMRCLAWMLSPNMFS